MRQQRKLIKDKINDANKKKAAEERLLRGPKVKRLPNQIGYVDNTQDFFVHLSDSDENSWAEEPSMSESDGDEFDYYEEGEPEEVPDDFDEEAHYDINGNKIEVQAAE